MKQTETILKRFELNKTLVLSLQKNKLLANYKAFNKSLSKLTENLTELEILSEELKKPADQIFTKKELYKSSLVINFKQVIGILNLVEGKRSKKIKKIYQSEKKLEKISDKQLISISKSAVSISNKMGGFSLEGFDKITSKVLKKNLRRLKKLLKIWDSPPIRSKNLKKLPLISPEQWLKQERFQKKYQGKQNVRLNCSMQAIKFLNVR